MVATVAVKELWTTLVDPNQLENALLNLCINARDAMPDGGKLAIEAANMVVDEREGRLRDLPPGQYVTLSVQDTGTGMAPEVVERAFEPFFTTKPLGMGTGLGLSMIYGFAKQAGGKTQIQSEVGNGTRVTLYLPRYLGQGQIEEAADSVPLTARAKNGRTVLVVDDEPTVRMLVVEVLSELGHMAIEAADAAQGLRMLEGAARVDLLISDVGLPGGMNGRQLADAARALRPSLKVLFITGYAEHAAIGAGQLEADMHVLTKPFLVDELSRRVSEILKTAQR